ncbi:MAG: MFS transporter [Gammaproteobacteria bacterium]|nr:MFS transporter [Gammaproteobacteria bacterium]
MRQVLPSIAALLLAVVLLMLSGGLQGSLTGLRAVHEGFPVTVAGLMMSAFYVGVIAGTRRCGPLINRVGHIRAFAAFCAINTVCILTFPLVIEPGVWLFLRAVMGFNMAGLYMAIESWLNATADARTRGTVMALYMGLSYSAMGGGQLLLTLGEIGDNRLFMLGAILGTLALVPVAVTRASHPAPVESSRFGFRDLYRRSPLAVLGCALAGTLGGSLFGVGPIYAGALGLDLDGIALFMGVLIFSGLLLQLPLGRLSDRLDRRIVIAGTALGVCAASLVLWPLTDYYSIPTLGANGEESRFLWLPDPVMLLVAAAACGGTIAAIYPLCVAHANDHIDKEHMVQASGGLMLAYGTGAIFGPVGASLGMQLAGPGGLFAFTGMVALLTASLALWRLRRGASTEDADKEAFVVMPLATTTPNLGELDPRAPEAGDDGDNDPPPVR